LAFVQYVDGTVQGPDDKQYDHNTNNTDTAKSARRAAPTTATTGASPTKDTAKLLLQIFDDFIQIRRTLLTPMLTPWIFIFIPGVSGFIPGHA
jgi:hypothetical protein